MPQRGMARQLVEGKIILDNYIMLSPLFTTSKPLGRTCRGHFCLLFSF